MADTTTSRVMSRSSRIVACLMRQRSNTFLAMTVGLVASALILLIGSFYGAIAGYFGGKTDMIMRVTN